MKLLITFSVVLLCASAALADVSHLDLGHSTTTTSTPPPPPKPYAFSYTAGRFPGHVDRQHTEEGDGSGVVRGIFQYVDPRNQVRTVEYQADEYGFHPALSHPLSPPQDTEAVKLGNQRHHELYERIAQQHQQQPQPAEATLPRDSYAVAHAKQHHMSLFERIAAEHARIGAEQEAARAAYEATSVPNELVAPEHDEQRQYGEYRQH